MDESRKAALRETGVVLLGTAIGTAVMLAVFAVLGKLDRSVLLGALLGLVLGVGNFFIMAANATVASDRAVNMNDTKSGTRLMGMSYILRLVLMFALLVVGVKSGLCNPWASVIPIVLVRPVLTIAEFFRKPKGQQPVKLTETEPSQADDP